MFLGTYTPKLDDKGRLTLPAKFRDALAGGLMVTKSQDHSLAVYPRAEFEQLARARRARHRGAIRRPGRSCATSPPAPTNSIPTHRAGSRCRPTTGATRTFPRTAWSSVRSTTWRSGMRRPGRTTSRPTKRTSPRPAMKHSATSYWRRMPVHRGLCPNRPWRTSPTPGSRLRTGTSMQGPPPLPSGRTGGGWRTVRDPCRWRIRVRRIRARTRPAGPLRRTAHARADPPPPRRRRRRPRRRHAGRGRARRTVPHRTARPAADRTRPRSQRPGYRPAPAGALRRPGPLVHTALRRLAGRWPNPVTQQRIGGRGALRPRRVVDAAGPRRARLRLRPGRTAGHADGSGRHR